MSSPNIHMNWSQEEHPSLEVLRAYHTGQLSAQASHAIESHLLTCELCSDVLEGMAQVAPVQTEQAVQDISHRLKHRLHSKKKKKRVVPGIGLDWRVAATLLILICSLGLVIYSQLSILRPEVVEEEITYEELFNVPKDTLDIMEPPLRVSSRYASSFRHKPASSTILYEAGSLSAKPELTDMGTAENQPGTLLPDSIATASLNNPADKVAITESSAVAPSLAGRASGVAITSSKSVQLRGTNSFAANMVKGKVVDAQSGEPLPGVTVQVKGMPVSIATDDKGEFRVSVPQPNTTLILNYIGYTPEELLLTQNSPDVEVKMNPDNEALSEVVVTSYEAQKSKAKPKTSTQLIHGSKDFQQYLRQNVRYPASAVKDQVKGKVVIGFTLNEKGKPENVRVLQSLHPACDAEAIRLVQESPAWQLEKQQGTSPAQPMKVSIKFKPPSK